MSKQPELLPCPFCGSAPEIEPWHGGGPLRRMISCINNSCNANCAVTGSTPALAARNWNKRTNAWQPIETIPMERDVLLWIVDADVPWAGHMQPDGNLYSRAHGLLNKDGAGRRLKCTHWQQLPVPPA